MSWLSVAEFSYNNTPLSSTSCPPFVMCYSFHPCFNSLTSASLIPSGEEWISSPGPRLLKLAPTTAVGGSLTTSCLEILSGCLAVIWRSLGLATSSMFDRLSCLLWTRWLGPMQSNWSYPHPFLGYTLSLTSPSLRGIFLQQARIEHLISRLSLAWQMTSWPLTHSPVY